MAESRGRREVLKLVLVLLFSGAGCQQSSGSELVLNTRLGRVRGRVELAESFATSGRRYLYAFRGLPYAEPPIGRLRWADPQPPARWTVDVLDARSFQQFCPQYDINRDMVVGDEDCLYLNVYTPRLPRPSDVGTGSLPVIVAVHGGEFQRGAASLLGPERFLREDLVLVTLNYRLGVMGFLSSEDATLPGNHALLDVVQALRWVRDFISDFTGDASRVTLLGQGSGAALVHMLLLSPRAGGLFHRVILQSGSALCPWALEMEPYDAAALVAHAVGCPDVSRDCLLAKTAEELVEEHHRLTRYVSFGSRMRPVVDADWREDPLLPAHPLRILESGDFTAMPMMTGLVPHEAMASIMYVYLGAERPQDAEYMEKEVTQWLIEQTLGCNYTGSYWGLTGAIKRQYLSGVDYADPTTVISRLSELLTDAWYVGCQQATARLHASSASVYAYLLVHRRADGPSRLAPLTRRARAQGVLGASSSRHLSTAITHGDDMLHLFMSPLPLGQYAAADQYVSALMTSMWANFAVAGVPTPQHTDPDPAGRPVWTASSNHQILFYPISATPQPLLVDFRSREAAFWTDTVPFLYDMAAESFAHQLATWLLLALCLLLLVALAVTLCVCRARVRSSKYDAADVVQRVMRTVRGGSAPTAR